MSEQELRELDAAVHRALYLDGDKDKLVPRYTIGLMAWEAVYELKPKWRWSTFEFGSVTWVTLHPAGPSSDPIMAEVWKHEARSLAAYALGRARCVLAWAEGVKDE